MKLHVLLIIGFTLSLTGCENKEQTAPEQEAEATTTAPAAESKATEEPAAEKASYYFDGIVKHMHAHADQVTLSTTPSPMTTSMPANYRPAGCGGTTR